MKRSREDRICKYIDMSIDSNFQYFVGSSAFFIPGLIPIPGAAVSQRLTNRIGLKYLDILVRCTPSQVNPTSTTYSHARYAIVFDRQNNGSPVAYGDVFGQSEQNGTISYSYNSFQNPANFERFVIVFLRDFVLPPVGPNGVATTASGLLVSDPNDHTIFNLSERIDLSGFETQFKASGGVSSDYSSGALLFFHVQDFATPIGEPFAYMLDCSYRLAFYDL